MTPYAVTRRSGNLIFISGQLPIGKSQKNVEGGMFEQTLQCLTNLEDILKKNGGEKKDLVKTTVFTVDLAQLKDINQAFVTFFESDFPTRSLFEVNGIVGEALVEIEGIATLNIQEDYR